MKQGINQGSAIAGIVGGTGASMDHHSSGFVDDGQVVVFIENLKRNIFGDSPQWWPGGRADYGDLLATAKLQGCPRRLVVHQNLLFGDKLLHARAAYIELSRQKLIQPFAGVLSRDRDKDWKSLGHLRGR